MTQIEQLTTANAQRVADLVREYMIMTEIERGNRGVKEKGLPPKLVEECENILEVYGDPNVFFLAHDRQRDLGGVGLKLMAGGESAEVCRLYVRDEARGLGIGSLLMERCVGFAAKNGIDRLVLDILPSRKKVIAWYEKLGFKPIAPYAQLPVPMVYMGLDIYRARNGISDEHTESVIGYYNRRESRVGYAVVTKGTKHYGYYPGGVRLSMAGAQRVMESNLGSRLGLPAGAKVLDAGCGEGYVAIHLAKEFGFDMYGVDLLDWSIKAANENKKKAGYPKLHFEMGDYTTTEYPDDFFDGVYTMETLVHSPNYRETLREFFRILKPGGVLVNHEYVLDDKLPAKDEQAWKVVFEECPMPTFRDFRVSRMAGIFEGEGFSEVVVRGETARITPFMKRFYLMALAPYCILKLFGKERRYINIFAAVQSYRLRKQFQYTIVRSVK